MVHARYSLVAYPHAFLNSQPMQRDLAVPQEPILVAAGDAQRRRDVLLAAVQA